MFNDRLIAIQLWKLNWAWNQGLPVEERQCGEVKCNTQFPMVITFGTLGFREAVFVQTDLGHLAPVLACSHARYPPTCLFLQKSRCKWVQKAA